MPEILASRPTPPLLLFAVNDNWTAWRNDGSCRDQIDYRAGDGHCHGHDYVKCSYFRQ